MAGRKPGTPKTGGRRKGSPNKLTATLKDMILGALDDAGGQAYLKRQSSDNPTAFLTLVGKVLPLQVSGPDGGPIETVTEIRETIVDPRAGNS